MNLEVITHVGSLIISVLCPPMIVLFIDQLAPPFTSKEKPSEEYQPSIDDEESYNPQESGYTVFGMDSVTFFWIICLAYIFLYIPGVVAAFTYYLAKIPHIRRFYQQSEDDQIEEMSGV